MKMNEDDFELRLQQTPLRRPPSEWREQILAAAEACRSEMQQRPVTKGSVPVRDATFAATWKARLRELFWPHPIAWGVITATWIAIGVLNAGSASHDHRSTAAPRTFYVVWQTALLEEDPWQEEWVSRPTSNQSSRTNSETAPRSQAMTEWRMT